jgi:hypothetical protein
MSKKQRPRLERFFNKIKMGFIVAWQKPAVSRPMSVGNVRDEQMELDLGLKDRERGSALGK